ncbi:MAG: hypothetical protein ACJA0X_002385 [Cyclobacteriaceae bacterium]|jgi:hypothetical protein
MQGYHLFEYATIRLMPKVERGEFINIGAILYCSGARFLECVFHWDEPRMLAVFPAVNIALVKEYSRSFELICKGSKAGAHEPVQSNPARNNPAQKNSSSGIAELAIAERFGWLTATRSTIIQASPVHTGYTQDAFATLHKIHVDLVKMG